jgi:hypothetical protein
MTARHLLLATLPLVLVSRVAMVNDTVALDHYILADLVHCSLCGAHPEVLEQVLARHGDVGIATVLCLPCRSADPDRERLRAVLEARYAAGRFGNHDNGGA